jgi:hypothetical protein
MANVQGTRVLVTAPTTGYASPYSVPSTIENNVLILQTESTDALTLHLKINDVPDGTTVVVDGKFQVILFQQYNDTAPESIEFGTRRLILVGANSFSSAIWDGTTLTAMTSLTSAVQSEFGPNTIEDDASYSLTVFGTGDTSAMRKFSLMSIGTPLVQATLESAAAVGDFNILLAGVNLLGLRLTLNTMLSSSNPCHITQAGATGTSSVIFAQAQDIVVLEDVVVTSGTANALTITNRRSVAESTLGLHLKKFTNGRTTGKPQVRLNSDLTVVGAMEIVTWNALTSAADFVDLDCDLILDVESAAAGQVTPLFMFDIIRLSGSLKVATFSDDLAPNLNNLVELTDVRVDARGVDYWEPKSRRIVFRGRGNLVPLPATLDTAVNLCVIDGLRVRYTSAQGRVVFDNVALISDVPENHTTKSTIANANYALVVKSVVDLFDSKSVPVNFERNSVVVVKHQDAYGMLFDSSGNKAHVRIAASGTTTIRSFRAYTGTAPLTNVGVVFMGANIADEPFDICKFDMSHMSFVAPTDDDEEAYLESIVFGTSAMSVDENGKSNLSAIVKSLVGQKPKWISRKGHHLTSWKYDEVPVLYRRIDPISGRKVLYSDDDGENAVPMRQDLVFILGLTNESSEFTGANGGLVGMDLELHSNANVDALEQDGLVTPAEAGGLLDELELKLFGKAGAGQLITPEVGIAGFMNSETGGSEIIRVFNAQPMGEVSIFFEPDEGFVQNDPSGEAKRRYYYLGDSVIKARFYDASTTPLFRSQHPSAWGLPAFSYLLSESDNVEAEIFYRDDSAFVLYDHTSEIEMKNNDTSVFVDPDHAFLYKSALWIDPAPQELTETPTDYSERKARLDALQIDGVSFSSRKAIPLSGSSKELYSFAYVTSEVFNLRHNTTTSTWENDHATQVVFRILPYIDKAENLTFDSDERLSALVLRNGEKVVLKMVANVQVVTTAPNVFMLKRAAESSDVLVDERLKLDTNMFEPNLFTPSLATNAQYDFDAANILNSIVTGETVRLGLTMFSRPSETTNPFVSTNLSSYQGKQLFAIIPVETTSRLYSATEAVNSFHPVSTPTAAQWTVVAIEKCTLKTIALEFTTGTFANGTYPVIEVDAADLGDQQALESSEVIRFTITPRTTDSGANMANQTMGRILCGRFSVVPLFQSISGINSTPTESRAFNTFSRVPTLYQITKGSQATVSTDELRRYHIYSQTDTTPSTLTVRFVARPHVISGQPELQLRFRTRTSQPQGQIDQFNLALPSPNPNGYALLGQTSPVTFRIADLTLSGKTSHRDFVLTTRWASSNITAVNTRIFEVQLVNVRRMSNDNVLTSSTLVNSPNILSSSPTPTSLEIGFSSVFLNYYPTPPGPLSLTDLETALNPSFSGGGGSGQPGGDDGEPGGGGGGGEPVFFESMSFDVAIRSSSRSGTTTLTTADSGFGRRITIQENRPLQEDETVLQYMTPSRTVGGGTGELTRTLASFAERIWVGIIPTSHVMTASEPPVPADLRVYFTAQISVTGGSVTGETKFFDSFYGGQEVDSTNRVLYTAPTTNVGDNPTWLGAWLDVSKLVVSGAPTSILCNISFHIQSKENQLTNFSNGVSVLLGRVNLTTAGRMELVEMSGTQLSSLRIGNWTLYSDAAGDLRAEHRTFTSGEGNGTDAGVSFTLDAPSVEALKTATSAVSVTGTGFRLTGHANTA